MTNIEFSLEEKFKNIDYNKAHILKSLIYFDNVKNSVFPEMIEETSWEEIKSEIENKVISCLKSL